jgi:hypothetical protein
MNFSTRHWNLKKAPLDMDMTVADTYVVDIGASEDALQHPPGPAKRGPRGTGDPGSNPASAGASSTAAALGTIRSRRMPTGASATWRPCKGATKSAAGSRLKGESGTGIRRGLPIFEPRSV